MKYIKHLIIIIYGGNKHYHKYSAVNKRSYSSPKHNDSELSCFVEEKDWLVLLPQLIQTSLRLQGVGHFKSKMFYVSDTYVK